MISDSWISSSFFCFNGYGVGTVLIALRFDLAALTRRIAILFFISNMLMKRHSDFSALGLLSVGGVMGDLGLLLVNPSRVETIANSRISLNCCWPSQPPACLYNLLMFWRHPCSKISLLLNYWSIPIVFIWSLRRGDCDIPLSTIHCFSSVSIKISQPINLVIILDLTHLYAWEYLPSICKHIYVLPTGGKFVGVFKFKKIVDVAPIRCAWLFGVDLVGMLEFCFLGVSQEFMS